MAAAADPLVTVNILSYNARETLLFVLEQLVASPFTDREIIVVDNASSDGSCEVVRRSHPDVRLIPLDKNIGIAGWNAGFREARGRYILVLDHDSFPAEGAIDKAIRCFERDDSLGLVAFRIVNHYDNSAGQSAEYDRLVKGDASRGVPVKRFVGGGAMIRRELLDAVGGYSETLFLYGFEADYAMRVIAAGYAVKYFPDLVAFHKVEPFSDAKVGNIIYYTVRNHLWMFWKYSPPGMALLKTVHLSGTFLVKAVRTGNIGVFAKAVRDGFLNKPTEFREKLVVHTQTLGYLLKRYFGEKL